MAPVPIGSSADAIRLARQHWQSMVANRDPVLSDGGASLAEVIRAAQIALVDAEPDSVALLTGSYLVAGSLPTSPTVPSDPVMRFSGLAAVVLGRFGHQLSGDREIAYWFRAVAGRYRGSVFVPRDVGDALAGSYKPLEYLALDTRNFGRVHALLNAAVADSRMAAAMAMVNSDPRYADESAMMRTKRAQEVLDSMTELPWRAEDRKMIAALTQRFGNTST